jgi:hypothetical protein
VVSLTLFLGHYCLAGELVECMASEPEALGSPETMLQIDRCIFLLESPVFARLRLHLLSADQYPGISFPFFNVNSYFFIKTTPLYLTSD